jgi:hypothetical protein
VDLYVIFPYVLRDIGKREDAARDVHFVTDRLLRTSAGYDKS